MAATYGAVPAVTEEQAGGSGTPNTAVCCGAGTQPCGEVPAPLQPQPRHRRSRHAKGPALFPCTEIKYQVTASPVPEPWGKAALKSPGNSGRAAF